MLGQALGQSTASPSPYLELHPQQAVSHEQLLGHLVYMEDANHSYSINSCCGNEAVLWQPLDEEIVDFGFSTSKFWLRLPVINGGETGGRWLLDLNTRFMNGLDAYLVTQQETELIVRDSETRPFSRRAIPHRQVVGAFELAAGERAHLVVGYWSRGTTVLPLAIETERTFYQDWLAENAVIVSFYSALGFMMLFGLAQFAILKSRVHLSYVLCIASGYLYIFHMDGLSFKYLWPQWPVWNANASLYLGLSIGIFSAVFAREFLRTRQAMPKIDKMLLAIIAAPIGIMLISLVVDMRGLKQYAYLVTTVGVFLCLLSGVVAYFNGQRDARFYVLGWISLFLAALFASLSHWVESYFPVPLTYDIAKIGLFVDALMFTMAMADQANEVRKQRDLAHERERKFLQQDLEAQRQMNLLEKQYQSALSLAQEKSDALASAGHDLRQPIFALKSAMNRVTQREGTDAATITQFRQGFDYIENLIRDYLELPKQLTPRTLDVPGTDVAVEEATADEEAVSHGQAEKGSDENFPVSIVLNNIFSMFNESAQAKGLTLSCVPCSARIKASPVAVMRIVSNLVENAIKYTPAGKVLIGCRRRQQHLDIQVIDTGPGLAKEQEETVFQAYSRGDNSEVEGLGLGLSIVRQLALRHGYKLQLYSLKNNGSVFQVSIPLASDN